MGIFDRFKKNKDENNSSENKSGNPDLSNPVIKKMVTWIEHPMEFGRKPATIEIIDQRPLYWPSKQNEDCYLLKYKMDDGSEYIGFTGPITWTFFSLDYSIISLEDLYIKYTGWFIVFFTINDEHYDKTSEGSNESSVIKNLNKKGYSNISTLQKAVLGGDNYYEFSAEKNGNKINLAGVGNDFHEFPFDYPLPYYQFIGKVWDPLNI